MLHGKAVIVSIWHYTRDSWIVPSLQHHSLSQKGISGDCLVQTPSAQDTASCPEQLGLNISQADESTTSPGSRVSLYSSVLTLSVARCSPCAEPSLQRQTIPTLSFSLSVPVCTPLLLFVPFALVYP